MRTLLDGAAAYERALIRARTKAALAAKRARGERAGEVPYGFTADDAGRLSPNAAEQEVLSVVRDLRAAGLSLRAIVIELGARGLVSRAGGAVRAHTGCADGKGSRRVTGRIVDLGRARRALARLDRVTAEHPELTSPEARERLDAWIATEEKGERDDTGR